LPAATARARTWLCAHETPALVLVGNRCTPLPDGRRFSGAYERHKFRNSIRERRQERAMQNKTSTGGSIKASNGNFTEQAEDLGQRAMEQLDELRAQAGEVGERVIAFIKERPGTSLLIAAAAGYLIGRIVRS
jgi:ElaB/YqjD/DUF883 family membrane-anchored ribosome-binding protein